MGQVPRCFVAADSQMPLELIRAHTFFRIGNEGHGQEPLG